MPALLCHKDTARKGDFGCLELCLYGIRELASINNIIVLILNLGPLQWTSLCVEVQCLTKHSRSLRFSCKLEPEERTFTMCGDPDYRAPEILLDQGYSFPIDW